MDTVVARARANEADVLVVGAGAIGLSCALAVLERQPEASVTVLERNGLCAGATGAGQGYIWMAQRDPSTPLWGLASTSRAMWETLISAPAPPGCTSSTATLGEAIGWDATGSLLLARTAEEADELRERASTLEDNGVPTKLLSASDLHEWEPCVTLPDEGGALYVESDAQVSGVALAHALLASCRACGDRFRYISGVDVRDVVLNVNGEANGVATEGHGVFHARSVVLAAGVWSGELLARLKGHQLWGDAFRPRKGHLLEMEVPSGMTPPSRGLMEISYARHYSAATVEEACRVEDDDEAEAPTDITFTATTSADGTLLLGSSREFSWEGSASDEVIGSILARAVDFLPSLAPLADAGQLQQVDYRSLRPAWEVESGEDGARLTRGTVRVGLRPFARSGLPSIGPVPGTPGLLLAAGHEGSGLCLGPATGDLIARYIAGEDTPEWADPLLPSARLCGGSMDDD